MARNITLPDGQRIPLAQLRRIIKDQKTPPAEQPALFELQLDMRPAGERTGRERYEAPSLFSWTP